MRCHQLANSTAFGRIWGLLIKDRLTDSGRGCESAGRKPKPVSKNPISVENQADLNRRFLDHVRLSLDLFLSTPTSGRRPVLPLTYKVESNKPIVITLNKAYFSKGPIQQDIIDLSYTDPNTIIYSRKHSESVYSPQTIPGSDPEQPIGNLYFEFEIGYTLKK